MNNQDYENKKRECWKEFRALDRKSPYSLREVNAFAFDRGYALGKQEKDAEGEEMLMCKKSRVHQQYKQASQLKDDSDPKWKLVGDQIERVLIGLFGSKCLPDEEGVDIAKLDKMLDEALEKETADSLNEWINSRKVPKPAEPKFKIGDKVKDISSPHDDGIYKVDDIKKSSDGFIYHIQGLIGKSNVKESALEPYPEPENESRNLSFYEQQEIVWNSVPDELKSKIESKYAEYNVEAFNGFAVGYCAAIRDIFGHNRFRIIK